MNHRWSGWPGAWCLDCGTEDVRELALADGIDQDGPEGFARLVMAYGKHPGLVDCKEPGSNRHNPYAIETLELLDQKQMAAIIARQDQLAKHQPRCTHCGSDQIQIMDKGVPARWRCRACRFHFVSEPPPP